MTTNLNGNNNANGFTVRNSTDANGTPSRNGAVTVQTSGGSTIYPGSSNREFDVEAKGGNDTLIAENMVWIGDGHPKIAFDDIKMGAGDDSVSLYRSAFKDLDMGDGNDTLILELAAGRDATLGSGNDFVRLGANPGETLSDAELAQKDGYNVMNLDGGHGVDTLNLQGEWTLTLSSGNVTIDTDNDGIGDLVTNVFSYQNANKIVGFPHVLNGTVSFGTITVNGKTMLSATKFRNFEFISAVCFTAGTMIETATGVVAIETLSEGDLVMTRNGLQPLRWIGTRRLDSIDLAGNPKLLPIRVPAGAFGNGLPTRDISFSPQHRVLIRSSIAERMFGAAEVLVPVKQLVGFNGIEVDGGAREVLYIHLMFEEHQIVPVEGIEAESLYPGQQALSFLSQDQLRELREIFPDFDTLCEQDVFASSVPFLKGRETRSLAARHVKNDRPFYS